MKILGSRSRRIGAGRRPPPATVRWGRRGSWRRRGLRFAAAASIAVGGSIHLCPYRNGLRAIPKIGVGLLMEVLTSAFVTVALLFGRGRILGLSLSLGTLAASSSPGLR
jgi:hypothetical protein